MNRAERRRAQRQGLTTDPLAITWYSNAAWAPTGYGTQTKQAVSRLIADGHHVAVANNYGLMATQLVYEDIPHYPMGTDFRYSNDVIEPTFRDWSRQHPDSKPLVVALYDAWPLDTPAWDRMPVAIWTMVDHLPVPPAVLEFLRKPNVQPLAASQFAHEQIQAAGVDSIYVPMAIDTDTYKPTATWRNGDEPLTGRQLMGFGDDVFVVSCVNANKSGNGVHRKAWAENLLAFSIFAESHDDVRLYLHTEKAGLYGGVRFPELLDSLGVKPHQYEFVNQWASHLGQIPNEAMAALYTATDVLLAPTYGEGFGLTTLEAAACGTVSILNDFTCQPETQAEGWLTSGQPWWDSYQGAWWNIPNVGSIVECLEAAYARGRGRSQAQIDHAAQYDADVVFRDFWRPALAQITNEPEPAVEPVPLPTSWTLNGDNPTPDLTIYVPAFKRPVELRALLDSLAPQVDERVEVIVSDDDPAGSAYVPTVAALSGTRARVQYERRRTNVGGDVNLLRGYQQGSAPWVWMIGDDDAALPGAVDSILGFIADAPGDLDRLLLLTDSAPRVAAGAVGTMPEIAAADPGLPIAATLITANVLRRDALDVPLGFERIETMYGHSWAQMSCRRVAVLSEPCFRVGTEHVNGYVNAKLTTDDVYDIWADLLVGYGIEQTPESFSWNFVRAAQQAALAP